MRLRKAGGLALALLLALAPSGVASAFGSSSSAQPLSIGGSTIGGPGKATISAGATAVLMDNIDGDVCATVSLGGTAVSATLRLLGDSSVTIGVDVGEVRALCLQDADTLEVDCDGATKCTVQWRVDRS